MSMSKTRLKSTAWNVFNFVRCNSALLLIISVLLLFPTKTLFNVPFFIMAIIGAYQLFRWRQQLFREHAIIALFVCFLCLWLPQLLALVDAANPVRARETVASYVHFLFAGVFMVIALQKQDVLKKLNIAVFVILTFWTVDALIQFFVGVNLFGYPYEQKGQLTGMFYPKIKLGHVVAVFLPFYFEFLRQYGHRHKWSWLLLGIFFIVLLLSGKRVAWMMAAIGCIAYFIYFCFYCRTVRIKNLLLPVATVMIAMIVFIWQHDPIRKRVDTTLMLFSGDYAQMEKATARRLSLWQTTVKMFKENWINGVGPRGFRYVYRDYASEGDYWLKDGREGSTHPHQALLEIAAEAGLIGLAGFLLFWCYMVFVSSRQLSRHHEFVPWLLCAAIAWFPANAHLAFYGSYWSSVGWWILCIALAQLFYRGEQTA